MKVVWTPIVAVPTLVWMILPFALVTKEDGEFNAREVFWFLVPFVTGIAVMAACIIFDTRRRRGARPEP